MSYPNAGLTVHEFAMAFSIHPLMFRDLMDGVINATNYARTVLMKYPHDGYDSITGEYNENKRKICDCSQPEFSSLGRDGMQLCPNCKGAGVIGGWKEEKIRGFFWHQIPPGLKSFSRVFSVTLPIDRRDAILYVSAYEKNIKNGNFIIINYATEVEIEKLEEMQVMNVRQVFIGETVIYKWIKLTKHPVEQTS